MCIQEYYCAFRRSIYMGQAKAIWPFMQFAEWRRVWNLEIYVLRPAYISNACYVCIPIQAPEQESQTSCTNFVYFLQYSLCLIYMELGEQIYSLNPMSFHTSNHCTPLTSSFHLIFQVYF